MSNQKGVGNRILTDGDLGEKGTYIPSNISDVKKYDLDKLETLLDESLQSFEKVYVLDMYLGTGIRLYVKTACDEEWDEVVANKQDKVTDYLESLGYQGIEIITSSVLSNKKNYFKGS